MSNSPKRELITSEVEIETEIFISAVKLSDKTISSTNDLLSYWGLTVLQFSALRVIYIHDKNNEGLSSKEIGSKLYTRVPDVTRLLDRLASKEWLIRERDSINRRVVRSRLTSKGIKLVETILIPMQAFESQQLSMLTESEKRRLLELLKKAVTE